MKQRLHIVNRLQSSGQHRANVLYITIHIFPIIKKCIKYLQIFLHVSKLSNLITGTKKKNITFFYQ